MPPRRSGGMADTLGSGPSERKLVGVRIPSSAVTPFSDPLVPAKATTAAAPPAQSDSPSRRGSWPLARLGFRLG